jgi:hypothetical protein
MQRLIGRPWFRRRSVGLGWRPATWQGWLITLVTAGLVIGVLALMRNSAERFPIVILIFALYAVVALLTGGARADAAAPTTSDTSRAVATSTDAKRPRAHDPRPLQTSGGDASLRHRQASRSSSSST